MNFFYTIFFPNVCTPSRAILRLTDKIVHTFWLLEKRFECIWAPEVQTSETRGIVRCCKRQKISTWCDIAPRHSKYQHANPTGLKSRWPLTHVSMHAYELSSLAPNDFLVTNETEHHDKAVYSQHYLKQNEIRYQLLIGRYTVNFKDWNRIKSSVFLS